jgi:YD repeat-containing protein
MATNSTSRLKSVTDALGQTRQYAYAADDRVSGISYLHPVNPTPNVGFAWDTYFPRLTAMSDGAGTTQYSYVAPGTLGALRLYEETGAPPAGAIAYAYDALGRVASRSIGGIVQETFQYDTLGRLVTHTDGLGQFSLNYLGETGQITERLGTVGAATWVTVWSYLNNTGDRRLALVRSSGLGAGAGQYSYTTIAEDFVTAVAESCSPTPCGTGWTYGYDTADRLTSGYPIGAASAYDYLLDPAGNINVFQSPTAPTKYAMYNPVNELMNLGVPPQTFSYDANGNLLSDGQRSYSWDAENRLAAIGYAAQPGKQTSFAYDGLGRRSAVTTTVSGTASTTYYLWCGSQLCQAVNPNGTVARSYFAEGETVAAPATGLYYGPDRLGSARYVAAFSGPPATAQIYNYDPYGNPIQTPAGSPLTDRRFAGMFYHADSGLYLTRTRAGACPGESRGPAHRPLAVPRPARRRRRPRRQPLPLRRQQPGQPDRPAGAGSRDYGHDSLVGARRPVPRQPQPPPARVGRSRNGVPAR